MAEAADTGMDKADMKKLLTRSKKEPVNCAVALSKDAALMLLDKIKQPKALVKALQKDFPDAKAPRWGQAFVDVDENPKLVILTLNAAAPGIARKLKKSLKGTGFSKVEIRLEDGSVAEAAGDEEEEEEGAAAPAHAAPGEDGPAAPPAAAAPDGLAMPDLGALQRQLGNLMKRLPEVLTGNPPNADTLKQMASDAVSALKAGNVAVATDLIHALADALGLTGAPLGGGAPGDGAHGAQGAATPNMAKFTKARAAWVATRQKVESDIGVLHKAMTDHYKGHGFGSQLDTYFTKTVEPVLGSLDSSLATKLDQVTGNKDPAQHAKLVSEAKEIIGGYEQYVANEPIIGKLDANPFTPLAIRKTLTASLSALSKAVA